MDWHTHINNIHWGGCCLTISLDLKGKDYQITGNPCLRNFGYYTATFRISIYDKKEDFAFRIVNFPHMDSNIPANPAYGVYISQLVRYYVSDSKTLKPLYFRNHLINSSVTMVLSSTCMVQPCGR